uniref:Putative glycosyltransferase n=1 Tax=viral metagenome TaxID=1070528 RepID=A0A6M3L127_9ZZZZ
MDIAFNLVKCNLGNNGGSQSIIRMACALRKLGHNINILIDRPSRFTWFPFPNELLKQVGKYISKWPRYDKIIATGCSTVWDTIEYPHLWLGNKFYWVRGYESWAMNEHDLLMGYRSGLNILVNSEWLQRGVFDMYDIDSRILYPGLPVKEIESSLSPIRKSLDKWGVLDKVIIGALYYVDKETKRFSDVIVIANKLQKLGKFGKLFLFGDKPIDIKYLNELSNINHEFVLRPNMIEKISLMSQCDIWLSTSINEGLHIPPMEAGLCGCNLVANGLASSGTLDYAEEEVTAKLFISCEIAVENILKYMDNPDIRLEHSNNLKGCLLNKIGSVEDNAKKFITLLEGEL